ncbi:ABC transporter permease [Polyangium mundeleinium]|uniref:ABC transporter permease n=1 Tax=Polyangium mundeleinium TaxID=2995306 RepID=A0ABT5ELM6_9BACT|nr:ABC transporter permease [Polyangium mundeleinium]MDC0742696.1 ABC transporter permease [Polyangium mundeleinium]
MKLAALVRLVRRDLARARRALAGSAFGITAGTATLVFFLALGLGVRAVLLGEVFPIDRIELEPPKAKDPGLLGLLLGGGGEPPGISPDDVAKLAALPGASRVRPKLSLAFPASARGGREILGHDVGAGELPGDGIDPALAANDVKPGLFVDPLDTPGPACTDDAACTGGAYCERATDAAEGRCSAPVPAIVSRYLVEIFDKSIAPAHGFPAVGETLLGRAQGITFTIRLGESLLGRAKQGSPRTIKARIVGISGSATDLGLTFPLGVVRRWNREFGGERAAERYSSAVVEASSGAEVAGVIDAGARMGLSPKDTRARDVSVLVSGVMALLSLVAGVVLVVSASSITQTFRALVLERRAEIALYRAVGATAGEIGAWTVSLAAVVGFFAGAAGLLVARILAFLADWAAAEKLPDFPFKPDTFFAFPWWLWLLGMGFSILFSVLGAIGPARAAAKVDPARALAGS